MASFAKPLFLRKGHSEHIDLEDARRWAAAVGLMQLLDQLAELLDSASVERHVLSEACYCSEMSENGSLVTDHKVSMRNIDNHFWLYHNCRPADVFICWGCGRLFYGIGSYEQHQKTHGLWEFGGNICS